MVRGATQPIVPTDLLKVVHRNVDLIYNLRQSKQKEVSEHLWHSKLTRPAGHQDQEPDPESEAS